MDALQESDPSRAGNGSNTQAIRTPLLFESFTQMMEAPGLRKPVSSGRKISTNAAALKAIEACARFASTTGSVHGGCGQYGQYFPFILEHTAGDNSEGGESVSGAGEVGAPSVAARLDMSEGQSDLTLGGGAAEETPGGDSTKGKGSLRSPPQPKGRPARGSSPRSAGHAFASPLATFSPRAQPSMGTLSAKAIMDEQSALGVSVRSQSLQDQFTDYFEDAVLAITGGAGPTTRIGDIDPLVASRLISVFHGQCLILGTVRATLSELVASTEEASLLLDRLSPSQLPRTVYQAITAAAGGRGKRVPGLSDLDMALGIPCFGRIAAHLLAPLLVQNAPDVEGELALAVSKVTIRGDALGLDIDVKALAAAMTGLRQSDGIDFRKPTSALVAIILGTQDITFQTSKLNWTLLTQQVSETWNDRERLRQPTTAEHLHELLETLEGAALISARLRDGVRRASGGGGGGGGGGTRAVFALSGATTTESAKSDLFGDPVDLDGVNVFMVGSRSQTALCTRAGCGGSNPRGVLNCGTCGNFLEAVYLCDKCQCPSKMRSDCRNYYCDVKWDPRIKPASLTELTPIGKKWLEKFTAARALRGVASRGAAPK